MDSILKIGVIGGGSIFTPELVELFAQYSDVLGKVEIKLMDCNKQRLEIVGGLCERIVNNLNKPVSVCYADTYEEAVKGADFVLIQFRVGGEDARINDEKLGKKYKIPFVETVSVCGFAAFLRTYYEMEKIAKTVREHAPDAWVMNFANPAGVLTEALYKLGCKKIVGVCNSSTFLIDYLSEKIGASRGELFLNWRGLNHLTFTDIVQYKGINIFHELFDKMEDYSSSSNPFPAALIKNLGYFPNQYLQYYYLKEDMVEKLQAQDKVRSEIVKEVNAEILELYGKIDYVPENLRKRGGYGYSRSVVNLIRGMVTNDHSIHYAVVKNGSILPELPFDAFVEVPVLALANDIRAIQVEPLPEAARSLVITMKQYDTMIIEAAQKRSKKLLLNALMVHPLISSFCLAEPLLNDVLEENKEFIPEFKENEKGGVV